MRSLITEEDKSSGTDAGGDVGCNETNNCPKFCDNDIGWGEGPAMNGCAHQLDDREDG